MKTGTRTRPLLYVAGVAQFPREKDPTCSTDKITVPNSRSQLVVSAARYRTRFHWNLSDWNDRLHHLTSSEIA